MARNNNFVSLEMEYRNISEVTRAVMNLPGKFARAKKSAMGSVGWYVMGELRSFVETGGSGWDGLHPLTATYWKKRLGGTKRWVKRRKAPEHPASWLGKFARYRVSQSGNTVQIDFGKGKRGKKPGKLDPQLSAIARRVDGGERIAVTARMRKKLAATWYRAAARGGKPVIGQNFFPLKKTTTSIDVPARPIFAPVFRRVKGVVAPFFEKKFWASYNRNAR